MEKDSVNDIEFQLTTLKILFINKNNFRLKPEPNIHCCHETHAATKVTIS